MKKLLSLICLLTAASMLVSCGEKAAPAPDAAISASSLEMTLGEKASLTVENYSGNVIWSSSDEKIASVSSSGEVSALSIGNAAVTAKIDGDVTMSSVVSVKAGTSSVTSISVTGYYSSSSDITLNYAQSNNTVLKALCTPNGGNEVLLWSSSNENVVTVDNGGYVTAHANGMANVTATAVNGVQGSCIIRVKNAPNEAQAVEEETSASDEVNEEATQFQLPKTLPTAQSNIVISDTRVYLDIGEDYQLSVTLSNQPEGAYVDFKSSDKAVAVVRFGRIVAVGEGIAVVSAITSDGAVANCYVAVGKEAKKELKNRQ